MYHKASASSRAEPPAASRRGAGASAALKSGLRYGRVMRGSPTIAIHAFPAQRMIDHILYWKQAGPVLIRKRDSGRKGSEAS